MIRSSHSRASDTSSAYSGSDIMQSSTNGDDCLMINNEENNETDDESEGSSEVNIKIFQIKKLIYFFSIHYLFMIIYEKY
jgi:hypothetical protein